ncbi:MAG: DUF4334 domain-containing protein [Flavipsychrobacter sp.]|nr:DUF4334 domain-containing protein [Flavipsychrobacter sp.]
MQTIDEIIAAGGTTTEAALQLYDDLEPITTNFMPGRWHGTEIPTGHQMDGLLKLTGWYGKLFIDTEHVHPLLFWTLDKKGVFAVNPKHIPLDMTFPKVDAIGVLAALLRVLETKDSKARMRMVEYRGKVSAAMCYDEKPIIDCFRKIDENRVMGAMDQKGVPQPYFFMLQRDDSPLELHF